MLRYCLPCICFALLVAFSSEASAQRSPGFSSRPTISPYINLFRGNTGGGLTNNFFQLVRPLQQQNAFNQQQQSQNRFMQQQMFGGGMGVGGGTVAPTQFDPNALSLRPTSATTAPTAAAMYFNYSHYYGQPVNAQQQLGNAGVGARRRR